ncbi:hypothetical protein [Streptomyces ziwulingensis]|uniref:Uncharacterized protein n=1 Tax=Streptomyces ziwulingensis TaxID=1045501 RepID=A0ABP9D598_9ACTN
MSIVPGFRRTHARHRGLTPTQLKQEIARLQREAGELTCQLVEVAIENDRLRADRNRVAAEREQEALANGKTIDDLADERDYWMTDARRLRDRFSAQIAADANAVRVEVPPMVRDTSDPADQATQPIAVITLAEAAAAGRLGPVTDPGRVA